MRTVEINTSDKAIRQAVIATLKQKYPSMRDGHCAYNGEEEGFHCVLGHLIPGYEDREALDEHETGILHADREGFDMVSDGKSLTAEQVEFFVSLQQTHDTAMHLNDFNDFGEVPIDEWMAQFNSVLEKHGVEPITEVEVLS